MKIVRIIENLWNYSWSTFKKVTIVLKLVIILFSSALVLYWIAKTCVLCYLVQAAISNIYLNIFFQIGMHRDRLDSSCSTTWMRHRIFAIIHWDRDEGPGRARRGLVAEERILNLAKQGPILSTIGAISQRFQLSLQLTNHPRRDVLRVSHQSYPLLISELVVTDKACFNRNIFWISTTNCIRVIRRYALKCKKIM